MIVLSDAESRELVELRARAYGRAGAPLTAAEVTRLQHLHSTVASVDGPAAVDENPRAPSETEAPAEVRSPEDRKRRGMLFVTLASATVVGIAAFVGGIAVGQTSDFSLRAAPLSDGYPPAAQESYERVTTALNGAQSSDLAPVFQDGPLTIWTGSLRDSPLRCSIKDDNGDVGVQCVSASTDEDFPLHFTWPDIATDSGVGEVRVDVREGSVTATYVLADSADEASAGASR